MRRNSESPRLFFFFASEAIDILDRSDPISAYRKTVLGSNGQKSFCSSPFSTSSSLPLLLTLNTVDDFSFLNELQTSFSLHINTVLTISFTIQPIKFGVQRRARR